MVKIYLSPALHGTDNPTKCPGKCSENTHCAQYMDIVERRLKEIGFTVRRAGNATGNTAMNARVREANLWRADIYYVAHTNAGGGRYSMTMCWNDEASRKKAEILHKYRQSVDRHIVRTNTELYEIRATKALCLYDELFFHDNAEDCAWFHNGGMQQMAEETVQALCEIGGLPYRPAASEEEAGNGPKGYRLFSVPLYASSSALRAAATVTGTYYRWDDRVLRGRVRITNSPDNIGKPGQVTGWVDAEAVM